METETSKKIAVIAHSGSLDRLLFLATLISSAASIGREVYVFFTYWALYKLAKGEMDRIDLPAPYEDLGKEMPLILEAMDMLPLDRFLKEAKEMGSVQFYACSQAMAVLGIQPEEISEKVDEVIGLVKFLELAEGGNLVYI